MQKFYLIPILIFIFGCSQKQNENKIAEFEKTLGVKETKALNLLVSDFENNLDNIYSDLPLEQAYRKYLTDLISSSTTDWKKFKFQSDKTNTEFHQSGLWNDIYTGDTIQGLQVNQAGKYMRSLYEIKDSNSLIKKCWEIKKAAGIVQNEIFVNAVLESNPDFNNYFHKRIVVLEFSF